MNILYINHYAGSPQHGMEYRPYYLAREWVRSGHNVRIVASSFSHVRAKQPDLGGRRRRNEMLNDVNYLWLAGASYHGNGMRRVWSMLVFLWRLYTSGRQLAQEVKPDVVIASSTYPMDIWPARRIALMTGAKLVYEVHDLWPLTPMELGGLSRHHPLMCWMQMAEDFAYRNADCVVSLLPNIHDHAIAHGLDPAKLTIVPNGIDPDEWQSARRALPDKLCKELSFIRTRARFIVGYAGTHGVANALDRLLACAEKMKQDDVAFVLVGDGPEKAALSTLASQKRLDRVHFLNPVDKARVPELLRWFDIAYVGSNKSVLYRFGISPNKLFDYMMAARPVLQCIDAPPGPVEHSGCGVCVASDDPGDSAHAIRRLLAMSREDRERMGLRGREYVLAHHTYPVLAARFLAAISGRRLANRVSTEYQTVD